MNQFQIIEANERKVSKVLFKPVSIDLAKAASNTKKMKRLVSTKVIKRKKQTQGDNGDDNSSLDPDSDDETISISREQLLLVTPEGPASVIRDEIDQIM